MEWVEVTGKSVAEAKERALDHLGVDELQAEFEVLAEPRSGIFGRLKGEARVRARIRPTHPRPKPERRDRRRDKDRDKDRDNSAAAPQPARDNAGGGERAGSASGGAPRTRGNQQRPRRDGASGEDRQSDRKRDADRTGAGAGSTAPPAGARIAQSAGARHEPPSNEEPEQTVNDEARDQVPSDDGRQTEHAVDFVTGLVGAFGVQATVGSVTVDDHYDEVQVTGADLGMLIGPKAAVLDAVQELARVVAQRRSGGRGESRLRIDIGGYRQRRREALERFAVKLAEEVQRSGVAKALEPMNSADRKVVHDIVGTLEGVATLSEGEDPRRRVVIVPRA
ncbi:MAG: RNA-binding cell elongation regulator Jag/EloR [Acidimicrobiales bacterium]